MSAFNVPGGADPAVAAALAALTTTVGGNSTQITALQGTVTSGRVGFALYSGLAATTAAAGVLGEVPATDAGTHTDPIVGGTVSNSGVYKYVTGSPNGWQWLYPSDASLAAASAAAAAVSTAASAASAAAAAVSTAASAVSAIAGKNNALLAGDVRNYTGIADVRPIIAGRTGVVLIGYSISKDQLAIELPFDNPGLTQAIRQRALVPGGSVRRYTGTGGAYQKYPIIAYQNGPILFGWDKLNDKVFGNGIPTDNPLIGVKIPLTPADVPIRRQVNGIVANGESVSVGTQSTPPVSTTAIYNAETFGGGVKSGTAGSTSGASNTVPGTSTLRALYEDTPALTADGTSDSGETVCSRAVKVALERASRLQGRLPADNRMFAAAAGRGGAIIEKIMKPSSGGVPYTASLYWWDNLIDVFTQATARYTALGLTFGVHAMPLIIGQNNSANAVRADWTTKLLTYTNDVNTDLLTITGQTTPVHILAYQTASSIQGTVNPGAIVLGWFDAINQSPRIHFATPYYFFPHGYGIHPGAVTQAWAGAYFGRAYNQLVEEGRVPDCVWPVATWARGTTLKIRFRTPTPLVIDTTTLGVMTDNGFKVVDNTGTLTLGQMWIENGDTLVIPLNRALGANPKVRAGLDYVGSLAQVAADSGTTGLHDTTSDTTVISGVTRNMYHWCPHFELAVSALDATS